MSDIITTNTDTDTVEQITDLTVDDNGNIIQADPIEDGTITSIVEATEVAVSDEVAVTPTDDDPLVLKVKSGMGKQRMGIEDQNSGLIMVCEAVYEANAKNDSKVKTAIAEAMGVPKTSAELTWRSHFGKLLTLPTDITADPIRIMPVDSETGEPLKDGGAAYYKGRLRKYLQQVAKADGIKPGEVMDELMKDSNTLQDALATIEAALATKHATVIENLFSTGSVTKALKMVQGKEPLVGDLDTAIVNAEALKVLLDTFLSEAENI